MHYKNTLHFITLLANVCTYKLWTLCDIVLGCSSEPLGQRLQYTHGSLCGTRSPFCRSLVWPRPFFLVPGRSLLPAMASSSTTIGRPCTSVSRVRQQRRDIMMCLWALMYLGGAALEVGASIPLRSVSRAWIYQYREFTSVHLHCLCVHCIICFPCITIKLIVCSIVWSVSSITEYEFDSFF